jgi:hypothetical protein
VPNNLTAAKKQMMGLALDRLREALLPIMQTSNMNYSSIPAGMNSTIEVQVPLRRPAPYNITPGHNPKAAEDYVVAERQIACDRWIGLDFVFNDLEFAETGIRELPTAISTTVDSLANQVITEYLETLYRGTYGAYGTAASIPFADGSTKPFTQGKMILKQQFTPMQRGGLNAFLTEEAEAEAMELRIFQDASFNGAGSNVTGAEPRRPFGFDMWCPQLMPSHTVGTATGYLLNGAVSDAYNFDSEGREVYSVAVDTGTGDFNPGDIINFAGDSDNYVVTSWNSVTRVIGIFPKPRVALADNATVTLRFTANHKVNILAHRDAMAFVTRPMKTNVPNGVVYGQLQDDRTGISISYEEERQYNQTKQELSIFFGCDLIRPEYAMRILQEP